MEIKYGNRWFIEERVSVLEFTKHPIWWFGIASGQTARRKIVNLDDSERRKFRLRFPDENGRVLKTVKKVIASKYSFRFLLPVSEIGLAARKQIRVAAVLPGDRIKHLSGSGEIFDAFPARDFDP